MSGDASTEAESAVSRGQVSLALASESLGNYALVISPKIRDFQWGIYSYTVEKAVITLEQNAPAKRKVGIRRSKRRSLMQKKPLHAFWCPGRTRHADAGM